MGVVEVLLVAIALVAVYIAIRLRRIASGRAAGRRGRGASGVQTGDGEDEAFELEFELRRLHRDVAILRGELDAQRVRVAGLEAQIQAQIQAQQQFAESQAQGVVSPEYDEALVFARRGMDVETIAERCGITVAEAALVRALAQQRGEPDEPR